ncbi:MAG: acyl-CoA/acyl-ACP dehydrogenase [Deltaproteobacteria bacterium]|nr:acyl-CoA/acyl-ACP dehydrogenase [Deltaproteobacteria bacterium]
MAYTELNLELSDEHEALKENVHKFAVEVLRPASLDLDRMSPEEVIAEGSIYWDCMKKMYANGYHTALIPDEYGGLGLDPLGVHIVFEEMSYGSVGLTVSLGVCCFSAFFASLIAEDHLIDNIILPFVNCKDASIMSCWAITEPEHGADILMPFTSFFNDPKITQQLRAEKKGDQWIINGQKAAWVSNGPIATHAALFVGIDKSQGMAGGGICLIDLDQPGVSRGKPLDKMGQRDLPQGEIYFDDAVCPEEYMIIDPESYEMFTDITLATANGCMGAFFTGVAQAAYDLALDYCRERVQGGKLLYEHATVQRTLFEMFMMIETSRAYSRAALQYNLSMNPPATQYSIASKVYCTEAAFKVTSMALQLLGGNGLTKEYPIEKLFRDARAGMIEDGSNDTLALAAANLILKSEE